MLKAVTVLPVLVSTSNHISNLIFTVLGTVPLAPAEDLNIHPSRLSKVKLLPVKRREKNKRVVLSRREKFHIVKAEVEPVMKALQRMSSTKFYDRIEQLHDMFDQLLLSWDEQDAGQITEDTDVADEPDVANVAREDDDGDDAPAMYDIDVHGTTRDPIDESEYVERDEDDVDKIVTKVVSQLVDLVELEAAKEDSTSNTSPALTQDDIWATSEQPAPSNISATSEHLDVNMAEDMEEDNDQLVGLQDVPVSSITEVQASQVSLPDLSSSQLSLPDLQEYVDTCREQQEAIDDARRRLDSLDVPDSVLSLRRRLEELDAVQRRLDPSRFNRIDPERLSALSSGAQDANASTYAVPQPSVRAQLALLKLPTPTKGKVRDGGNGKKNMQRLQIKESDGFGIPIVDVNLCCSYSSCLHIVSKVLSQLPSVITSRRLPVASKAQQGRDVGMHPYAIQKSSAAKMLAAITTKQDRDKAKNEFVPYDPDAEDPQTIYFAHDGVDATTYNEMYLSAVIVHHDLAAASKRWANDFSWVKGKLPKYSGIFDHAFPEQVFAQSPTPFEHITSNVLSRFSSTPFGTTYSTLRAPTHKSIEIKFQDVVGKVAGKQWISDAVLNFVLNKIVEDRDDVYVIDPLMTSRTRSKPPTFDIRTVKYVVHPQNIDNVHWVVTVFEFDWLREQDNLVIHMYDPLGGQDAVDLMLVTWKTFTLDWLERWLYRDHSGAQFSNITESTPQSPRQKDGWNCGFLCIVFVNMVVNKRQPDPTLMKKEVISDADLAALRFKILHLIMVDSVTIQWGSRVSSKVEHAHAQIAQYIP